MSSFIDNLNVVVLSIIQKKHSKPQNEEYQDNKTNAMV